MNVRFAAKSDDGVSLGGQDPQNSPPGGLCFPRVAWMQAFLGLGRKGTFDKLYMNHFLRSWGSVLFKADAHML